MAHSAQEITTSYQSSLGLLLSLPIAHPTFITLLRSHTPLARPSAVSSQVSKLLSRINSALLAKDNEAERRVAFVAARLAVLQDAEGHALDSWGKSWVTAALSAVASSSLVLSSLSEPLDLLASLILTSPQYPSFERETIHPILGKVAVTVARLLERAIAENADLEIIVGPYFWNFTDNQATVLANTKSILDYSPAPFRPVVPTLKPSLLTVILSLPVTSANSSAATPLNAPPELKQSAADLLASLHLTSGKAQIPASWAALMRDALAGFTEAMSGITRDGWEEETVKASAPALPAGLPALPVDPASRLAACLDWLEGFTEQALALLKYPTLRPVPIPVAQIVSIALRMLNLTLETPHNAALLAALPRMWTSGLLLLGAVTTATGDHVLPHLSNILDHTVWLSERTPVSMATTHVQLLRFHRLLFELYPPALAPVDFTTRLLRLCLSRYAPLLDSKSTSTSGPVVAGGKRGKKRARGAEDGLIGGLEGREGRSVPNEVVDVALEALRLSALLHPAPLLNPSLLTFSIRLHLSLYLHLASIPSTSFERSEAVYDLRSTVSHVLEQALYMTEGDQGTAKGWKVAILSVITSLLLHPSLPPLNRPQPPLSALHFFTHENEEERKIRRELGYPLAGEESKKEEVMDVDEEILPTASIKSQAVELAPPVAQPTLIPPTPPAPIAPPITAPPVVQVAAPKTVEVQRETEVVVEKIVSAAPTATESSIPVAAPSVPFVSSVQTESSAQGNTGEVVQQTARVTTFADGDDDDDEPLPELDIGSSDEDEEDEDEEDEDEEDVEEEE